MHTFLCRENNGHVRMKQVSLLETHRVLLCSLWIPGFSFKTDRTSHTHSFFLLGCSSPQVVDVHRRKTNAQGMCFIPFFLSGHHPEEKKRKKGKKKKKKKKEREECCGGPKPPCSVFFDSKKKKNVEKKPWIKHMHFVHVFAGWTPNVFLSDCSCCWLCFCCWLVVQCLSFLSFLFFCCTS